MLEESLRRRLRRATALVACACALLLGGGGIFSAYLLHAREQILAQQVAAEAEEYKSRILKQLQADFQTLASLSAFIEPDMDRALLAERLSRTQEYNDFVTVAYFAQDGSGVMASIDERRTAEATLDETAEDARRSVEAALSGEYAVSRLFASKLSDRRVFVYSVPVWDGGEVVGALAASDHIEIFADILTGNTVLGGGGYIHLIDSEGDFLLRSSKTIVKEAVPSIFDGPYLSEESQGEVRAALQGQERISSSFSYGGKSYPFLLEPMGVNNWYLFCVNTGEGLSASSNSATYVTMAVFAAVVLLIVLLIFYGYRALRRYNRGVLHAAYHDPLTGAENMSRFRMRLGEALAGGAGSVTALCVRQFPFLTEIFGAEASRRLLRRIREILESRASDGEFFCREAEDRFYIFFRSVEPEAIRARLREIADEIERYPLSDRSDYRLALYCGVTLSSPGNDAQAEAENMLARVQFALDKARGGHESTIWFFDAELHKQEELENYVESHMHHALQSEEFKLYLQPKVNLASGALSGAEALVRWRTGGGKMIYPNQFIPLFEKNGFCARLDLYMVERACRQIRAWLDCGIEPIPISVNQSKLLFFEADYARDLTALLEKYRVPAKYIILEILEGLALENVEALNAKIAQLREIGFRISLDDFGSGYSSLNTLGNLKIDEVKLDREFLLGASGEKRERVRLIMEEIVRLAGRLGIETIAEGVETAQDEQLLRAIGCGAGQGYYYSRPLSAEEFDKTYMQGAKKE